uniref:hypothetical protein n=1 Tax=uncultured Methylibium sp. TaxID=381093 RepID=UPI002600E11D
FGNRLIRETGGVAFQDPNCELGPRLLVGLPMLIEGGTEVVIDVRVLRRTDGERLMDTRTQWRNGGTFVIKGVGSLDVDLSAALRSAFAPVSPRR